MAFITSNHPASLSSSALEVGLPVASSDASNSGSQSTLAVPDGIHPISLNPVFANPNQPIGQAAEGQSSAFGSGNGAGSAGDFTSIANTILQTISTLISQIVSLFSSASANANAASYGGPSSPVAPETTFTNATASSVGDPHEAFKGTTASGGTVSGKWDNMNGHNDLLDSNAFYGGFRVSTTVTAPDANGVTHNASATVTTHDGNDSVELNKDGSYTVLDHGQNVALTTGQAVALGHNESVTLNADESLTIAESNQNGASLTTTLSNNGIGTGVDVNASGSNVALGGYLVNKTDRYTEPVARLQPNPYPSYPLPGWQAPSGISQPLQPLQYGTESEPVGAGEIEFA